MRPAEPTIVVIRIDDFKEKTIAVLVNYSYHPSIYKQKVYEEINSI